MVTIPRLLKRLVPRCVAALMIFTLTSQAAMAQSVLRDEIGRAHV